MYLLCITFCAIFLSASSWPKVVVNVDPSNVDRPFFTTHTPPLPSLEGVCVCQGRLSVEELLGKCISARSRALLEEVQAGLRGTAWEQLGMYKAPSSVSIE